jgi:hypothetical protein
MYAVSLLKHVATTIAVVLSKSQGLQKRLAPYRTDVHRVACTIDGCILELLIDGTFAAFDRCLPIFLKPGLLLDHLFLLQLSLF